MVKSKDAEGRPKLFRRRAEPSRRVDYVPVDQLAACPKCGTLMRLSEKNNFQCKCGYEAAAEAVVEALAPVAR